MRYLIFARTALLAVVASCLSISAQVNSAPADPVAQPGSEPIQDARDRIFYPGDTERWKPLARKLAGNVLLDQKEIWTSPFRMHARDAKWWIGIGGVTAALIATDHSTSTAFNNSRGQISWGNNLSRMGASYTLLPIIAGFYGYGVVKDRAKPREVGVLGAEALLDSLIVVEILKPIAGRNRPDSSREAGHFFEGGDSFPSGHAIESWAIASVIAHEYGHGTKWVPVLVYGLATVVTGARVAAQRHYISDAVVGGTMGWFIGRYVYQTHMDHSIHRHLVGRPRIAPEIRPSQRLYGVALTFGDW
jgi:membrane-associated phospholipid phosphatase